MEDVVHLYGGILESPSPDDDQGIDDLSETWEFAPITIKEVKRSIKSWTNSALGRYGISVAKMRGVPSAHLVALFKVIVYFNVQPKSSGEMRTVLIPKDGDRRSANNWRPLTIRTAAQRLLHRILHARFALKQL